MASGARPADLDQPEPAHRKPRRPDHQEQDLLLCALGPADRAPAFSASRCSDGLAPGTAFSVTGRLGVTATSSGHQPHRATRRSPSVDSFGNPVRPATNPNGTPYTGQLRYFSVFGPVGEYADEAGLLRCRHHAGAAWDSNRTGMDPGYHPEISRSDAACQPFSTAATVSTRPVINGYIAGTITRNFGLATATSTDTDRRQINTKIDHNFNSRNKVALNYSYEWVDGDYLPRHQRVAGRISRPKWCAGRKC